MIISGLAVVVTSILLIIYFHQDWWGLEGLEILCSILLGFCCGVLIFIILLPISLYAFDYSNNVKYEEKETIELYALQDSHNISGLFFLGSGAVNDKMVYYYVEKDQDGFMSIKNIPVAKTKIKYTDEQPKLVKFDKTSQMKWYQYFYLIPLEDEVYKVYIPAGSVINDYSIDLR